MLDMAHARHRHDGLSAQEHFDRTYITSTQIAVQLNVTRSTVMQMRLTGKLPDPIAVNDSLIYIWERNTAEDYMKRWLTKEPGI